MSRNQLLPLVVLGLVVFAGCPQGAEHQRSVSTPNAAQETITPQEELKGQLESLAETGEMFPGSENIADNIAAVKAADADKGAALEADFEALNKALGNPAQVKAKATEMLGKL